MPLFVTVTPGTTVTNSTTIDATTLNLLGTPAIDVIGTVDGGSLSLSAGSVGQDALAVHAVTNAKMATMAANTIKGNNTGSSADPLDLTVAQVKTMLAVNPTGGLENATTNIQIANSGVSYAKIQNVAASRLLGNPTGSAAAPSEISLGTGLSFSGTVLNASGKRIDLQLCPPSSLTSVSIPEASVISSYPGLGYFPSQSNTAGEYFVFSTEFIPTNYSVTFTRYSNQPSACGFKLQWSASSSVSGTWTDVDAGFSMNGDVATTVRSSGSVSVTGTPSVVYFRLKVVNATGNNLTVGVVGMTLSLWN